MAAELFHEIADPDSAAARRAVVDLDLKDRVDFRNLHYPEARADFAARGGTHVPALWDGATLHQGLAAVTAQLKRMKERGA